MLELEGRFDLSCVSVSHLIIWLCNISKSPTLLEGNKKGWRLYSALIYCNIGMDNARSPKKMVVPCPSKQFYEKGIRGWYVQWSKKN